MYKTIEEYDDLNKEYDLSTEEVIRKKDEIFKSVIVANRQIEQYFNILGYEIILPKIGEYFNEEIMTPLITEEKNITIT